MIESEALRRVVARAVRDALAAPDDLGRAAEAALAARAAEAASRASRSCRRAVERAVGPRATRPDRREPYLVVEAARRAIAAAPQEWSVVPDLAREIGVSPRVPERDFVRVLGKTPTAYARYVRSRAAWRDIVSGSTAAVTDVALRWGFWHFGRFSAYYRQAFGEAPSATLRRTASPGPLSPPDAGTQSRGDPVSRPSCPAAPGPPRRRSRPTASGSGRTATEPASAPGATVATVGWRDRWV